MALESFVQISMPLSPPLMPLSSSSVEYGSIAMPDEMCIFEADSTGLMEDQNSFAGLCNGGFPLGAFGNMVQVCAPTMHPNLVSTLRNVITRPSCPTVLQQVHANELEFLQAHQGFDPQPENVIVQEGGIDDGSPCAEGLANACDATARKAQQKTRRNSKAKAGEAEDRQIANVSVDLIQNRRPFKCAYGGCNKTFKNRQTLKMHHKTHYSDDTASRLESQFLNTAGTSCRAGHNKKIPCRCPVCSRTFVGLYELRRHFGRKHSEGEKMHGCRKCGKRFYIEVDLRDHEKLCGEPIECKCGMKFAFKCNLVAHRKTHPECQESTSSSPSTTEEYSSSSYSYRQIHPNLSSAPIVNSSQCKTIFTEDSSSSSSSLALMIPSGVKLEGIGNFPCILPPDLLGHSPMML